MKKIRWGVVGSGSIVNLWLCGAMQVKEMEVVAIASRTKKNAQDVATRFGIPHVEESYQTLLDREDIDVIYIGVPHTFHYDFTMLALKNGKHVLCEKPLGINSQETQAMFAQAKKQNLFLMEAMWMRFFPAIAEVKKIIRSGELGELKSITATFGGNADVDRSHRLFNPHLAGGALLDVGVYCLQFCDALLDAEPLEVSGMASIARDKDMFGVDEQDFVIAKYPNDILVDLRFALKNALGQDATLSFSKGSVYLPRFWSPVSYSIQKGGKVTTLEFPVPNPTSEYKDTGFQYEIRHVNECLSEGLLESPVMSSTKTNQTMGLCDELRNSWGLIYPSESKIL